MTRSRLITIIIAVIAAVAVGITTWFVIFRDTPATGEIGEGVRITNTAPRKLKASASNKKPPVQKGLGEFISTTYDIGPSGPLATPTTLELPLNRKASSKERLVVFTAPMGGKWSVLPAKLMPGGRSVQVTTAHLSLFSVVSLNIGKAFEQLKQLVREFYDGLSSGATAEAAPPKCQNEADARTDNYAIDSSHKDTVYWCFGIEGGKRIIKMVNNRRYPLLAGYKRLKLTSSGEYKAWSLDQLARYLAQGDAVIFPRDQVTFSADLSADLFSNAYVRTRHDGVAWALNQLQVGVETAAMLLTHFGMGAPRNAREIISMLLDNPACAANFANSKKNAGEIVRDCLSSKMIMQVFGNAGLLLVPVMALGGVAEHFRSTANMAFDSLNGRDKYTLVVSRQGGKAISFRGMTIRVPQSWNEIEPEGKPEGIEYDGKIISNGLSCVTVKFNSATWRECPGFFIDGPGEIAKAWENGPYEVQLPYHPGTGVTFCPGVSAYRSDTQNVASGFKSIGDKKAIYREWRISCGTSKTGSPPYKRVGRMTQRIWYLPESQILILDEWNTPGLPEILANATWK